MYIERFRLDVKIIVKASTSGKQLLIDISTVHGDILPKLSRTKSSYLSVARD